MEGRRCVGLYDGADEGCLDRLDEGELVGSFEGVAVGVLLGTRLGEDERLTGAFEGGPNIVGLADG
jgi:hypothetical protein